MKVKEQRLREDRGNLVKQMDEIMKSVEAAHREMNEPEKRAFDALKTQAERLDRDIRECVAEREEEERQLGVDPDFVPPRGDMGDSMRSDYGSVTTEDGREIRVYAPNESLRSSLTQKERDQCKDLKLSRYIAGLVTGDWDGRENEKRAMMEGVDPSGGYLVPGALSTHLIDMARAKSVCFRAGAGTIPMNTSTLDIARIDSGHSAYWRAEGNEITDGDMSLGKYVLTARTVAAIGSISVELLEDARNIGQVIEEDVAQALALKLDYAALKGEGANSEPLGIRNMTGTGDVNFIDKSSNPLDVYTDILTGMKDVEEGNAEVNAAIMSPLTWYYINSRLDGNGNPLQEPRLWADLPNKLRTTSIDDDELFLGNFRQMKFAIRTEMRFEVGHDATSFKKMLVWYRAYLRADVFVEHRDHFSVIHDYTTGDFT